ncbi:hypothetical protein [Mesobacillus sp.]|uniref:hypothetical protein n=1 Tax=Mesobacillus sp. TaxID=2675271 RepID=UPI0039EE5FA1
MVELQTGLKGIKEKLSEHGATSDRFKGNQREAVRTWCNFRQDLKEIREKLSEHGATSDRFGGN